MEYIRIHNIVEILNFQYNCNDDYNVLCTCLYAKPLWPCKRALNASLGELPINGTDEYKEGDHDTMVSIMIIGKKNLSI